MGAGVEYSPHGHRQMGGKLFDVTHSRIDGVAARGIPTVAAPTHPSPPPNWGGETNQARDINRIYEAKTGAYVSHLRLLGA